MTCRLSNLVAAVALVLLLPTFQRAQDQTEFFEKKVRPVLVKNCQPCHNPKSRSSGLDLSSAAGVAAGGTSGPLIARENPENSRILRAIGYEETLKMPPMGKLSAEDSSAITAWVKLGAPWPGTAPVATLEPASLSSARITPEHRKFWAFQDIQSVKPPRVANNAWVRSPIDRFILAKLEAKQIPPSPPADKARLLRRATYDLTGLPPTEAELQAFLADRSPEAYNKVIDRLLASPRYGERWGRHWLDVVRYADSTGNDEDHRYPFAYRYRDYVIHAFNTDLPFDQFVREQVAGDLLPPPAGQRFNTQGTVATGFLAVGPKALAQKDIKKMMYDIYDEQVDVTSRAFLGLTMACARCHDHKFDPILTRDYYSMVNIFANTRAFDGPMGSSKLLQIPLVPAEDWNAYRAQQTKVAELKLSMDRMTDAAYERFLRDFVTHIDEYAPAGAVADARKRFEALLTARFAALAAWEKFARERIKDGERLPGRPPIDRKDPFFADLISGSGPLARTAEELQQLLSPEDREKYAAFRKELDEINTHLLPAPDMATAVRDGDRVDQKVFLRGDHNNLGEDAPKAFPVVLARDSDPHFETGSGRRELAKWLSSPRNPLTARVIVNRIWQWHFGEGIVRTPDNFGKMGDRPTHPELLDYLAAQFMRSGWSIKAMHRTIMLSSAYRMSSEPGPKAAQTDPENLLLSHFNRRRLEIEELRDGLLAIDGSLDLAMGGTLQTGTGTDGENAAGRLSMDPVKVKRRTVYLPLRRANLPTLLNLFDFGDATTPNGKRLLTNVAPQALFMMNSDFVFERADKFAQALLAEPAPSDTERLRRSYLRIVNRAPAAAEIDAGLSYIRNYAAKYGKSPADGWQSFCHVLMLSNDFVYLD
ncbi:MAG TPA: PSD1 and planctomycete cytochrome C domain-containing protein [Bryobacteraceae bacterium]|nr:PSD1 and planctomycete cytochrome C domain-containing protein [Bryobacteraceae bacterium]